jgi:integrase
VSITDMGMQATPNDGDQWLTESFGKGNGALLGRITPAGSRAFYYRYAGTGGQVRLPIGQFNKKGNGAASFTVAQARAKALQWSVLRRDNGIADLREYFAQLDADRLHAQEIERRRLTDEEQQRLKAAEAAQIAELRRLTFRQVFDEWRDADLQPRIRADGKRSGRVDGGLYVFEQFTRHVFPHLGSTALEDVRKADLLALLDTQKSAGKMRTANVLLTDLKQMLDFALEREIIDRNPLATVKKSKVGGPSVERERVLSDDEIKLMVSGIGKARLNARSAAAIWLTLATGVRVGELMGAIWAEDLPESPKLGKARLDALRKLAEAEEVKLGLVNIEARTWYLPDTKNQRDHTIHLSKFAVTQLELLRGLREAMPTGEPSPWMFPATDSARPVCVKSFGKQLADRQRPDTEPLKRRSKKTTSLALPGGRWTAHDLRRTAATVMARCGFGSDTINECLNHIQSDRMSRVYIKDRREADQARAFDALGAKLTELITGAVISNVAPLGAAS